MLGHVLLANDEGGEKFAAATEVNVTPRRLGYAKGTADAYRRVVVFHYQFFEQTVSFSCSLYPTITI